MQSGLFVLSPPEIQNSNISEIDKEISVFPNPFNDEINIHINNQSECTAYIHDMNGKLLISKNINKKLVLQPKIDSGIYFLEIKSEENSYKKKIIRL